MINFTVGPVMMDPEIRELGKNEVPYFRNDAFSQVMKENEQMLLSAMKAPEGSRAVFLTGSGTAAMEAAVMNLFGGQDRVLVVDGGSFGARFAQICGIHGIPHEEIRLETGQALTEEMLEAYRGKGFTGLLVNVCETSTGVLYDMRMISSFCRREGLRLVTDAISSFLADDTDMAGWGADLVLTGSQKGLALPPGISAMAISPRGAERIARQETRSLYFDLKAYLRDGERGQTPFTPAVGILLQMHRRLEKITEQGPDSVVAATHALAEDFRRKIRHLPLEMVTKAAASAVTPLHPTGVGRDGRPVSARDVFRVLEAEYGIWICPSGGALADYMFRVGHIGYLTPGDNDRLVEALDDLVKRGML